MNIVFLHLDYFERNFLQIFALETDYNSSFSSHAVMCSVFSLCIQFVQICLSLQFKTIYDLKKQVTVVLILSVSALPRCRVSMIAVTYK